MSAIVSVKRQDGMESSQSFSNVDDAVAFYKARCDDASTKRAWVMRGSRIVMSWSATFGELVRQDPQIEQNEYQKDWLEDRDGAYR